MGAEPDANPLTETEQPEQSNTTLDGSERHPQAGAPLEKNIVTELESTGAAGCAPSTLQKLYTVISTSKLGIFGLLNEYEITPHFVVRFDIGVMLPIPDGIEADGIRFVTPGAITADGTTGFCTIPP